MRAVIPLAIVAAFAAGVGLGRRMPREGRGAGRSASARARTVARARTDRETPSLRKQLEAIPFTPIPSGRGRISGRVVNAAGEPMEGVLVVATPSSLSASIEQPRAAGGPGDEDIVEVVRAYASYLRTRLHGRRRTRSDAGGRFELSQLGARGYQIEAFKEGYEIEIGGLPFPTEIRPDAEVVFEAKRVVRVLVEVLLPDGTRPTRARLGWTRIIRPGSTTGRNESWRSEAPWVDLTPGTYRIHAALWDDLETRSRPVSFVVFEGKAALPLTLRIAAKPGLVVHLRLADGFLSGDMRSWLVRMTGPELPSDLELTRSVLSKRIWAGNHEQGEWPNLEAGKYLVGAGLAGGKRVLIRKVVELTDGLLDCSLQLPVPDPSESFLARPVSPEGRPLGEITWSIDSGPDARLGRRGTTAMRRTDGTYYVTVPPGLEGEQILVASHPRFGEVQRRVASDWTDAVVFPFDPPAWAEVTIDGPVEPELEGRLRVSLQVSETRSWIRALPDDLKPDDHRMQRLGPVQPGEFFLVLDRIESDGNGVQLAARRVTLRPGVHRVSIANPPVYALRVIWTGAGAPRIQLERAGAGWSFPVTPLTPDPDGVVLFGGVPAGEYRIRVRGVSYRGRPTVKIPDTPEVRLP